MNWLKIFEIRRFSCSEQERSVRRHFSSATNSHAHFTGSIIDSHLEVAIKTESSAPRVSAQVVFNSIVISTVTNHFNGMSSKQASGDVAVGSALVRHEVLVHVESGLERSIVESLLDSGVGSVTLRWALLASVMHGRFIVATIASSSATSRGVGVNLVSDSTFLLKVLESVVKESTSTSVVIAVTGNKLLRGENDIDFSVWLNGKSVAKSLGGTKGPAGSAPSLVSNRVDVVSPLISGVKGLAGHKSGVWKSVY